MRRAGELQLIRIEKIIHDEFIALDCWDYTIYPHEQVFRDVQSLNASLEALDAAIIDPDAAAGPLWDVGQMYYGLTFSYDAFVDDQKRHDPTYYRIAWVARVSSRRTWTSSPSTTRSTPASTLPPRPA